MTSLQSMPGACDFATQPPAWLLTSPPAMSPSPGLRVLPHATLIEYSATRALVQLLFARRAELNTSLNNS
jgi:hypothetical protein